MKNERIIKKKQQLFLLLFLCFLRNERESFISFFLSLYLSMKSILIEEVHYSFEQKSEYWRKLHWFISFSSIYFLHYMHIYIYACYFFSMDTTWFTLTCTTFQMIGYRFSKTSEKKKIQEMTWNEFSTIFFSLYFFTDFVVGLLCFD